MIVVAALKVRCNTCGGEGPWAKTGTADSPTADARTIAGALGWVVLLDSENTRPVMDLCPACSSSVVEDVGPGERVAAVLDTVSLELGGVSINVEGFAAAVDSDVWDRVRAGNPSAMWPGR